MLGSLVLCAPLLGNVQSALLTYAPGLVLHLLHLLWLRSGPSRAVAISHCLSYFIWMTSVLAFQLGGLRAPAALVYPPLVLMAGLVWSGPAAIGMAISSCAAGATLVWLEARGLLPEGDAPLTPLRLLMVLTACVIVTAVMIRYALGIIRHTTREALASEQRHAEQRQRLELELREAQRVEALGRLAGGVAHDFNNLLTVIMGYTAMLPRATRADAEAADAIELAAERARTLTQQLLAFGRRQILRPEVLDLSDALRELQPLISPLLNADIALELGLADTACIAEVDRAQLGQVVINLIANAKDSMPEGGTLSLETGLGVPGDYAGETVLPSQNVWLSVRDTGSGIEQELASRVFEPFFTTKAPSRGTGLGLATVHGIVTQSGGVVAVESRKGAGSRFIISLPASNKALATPREKLARSPHASPQPATRIFVVDDDAALLGIMRRVLENAGYEVSAAEGAASALQQMQRADRPFDLLVSDVMMSGMNGPELA
ncbi:MAG TPA: ATP-binding protein, partial [Polyangiaceae bacterium]|nr:ATP-binding protein [Polyangiaceae bacterium]